MIDNFINSIGGYNSWQFTVLFLGTLIIGFALRQKWIWAMPVPLFGIFLGYLTIENAYIIAKPDFPDADISFIASTFPILFFVIGLFVAIVVTRMLEISRKKEK